MAYLGNRGAPWKRHTELKEAHNEEQIGHSPPPSLRGCNHHHQLGGSSRGEREGGGGEWHCTPYYPLCIYLAIRN